MKKNEKGFTIIEVALVLAIAAMIFLVVFLAVPALQRNQRDDARKRDISNVVTYVTTYYANTSNGALADGYVAYSNGTKQSGGLGDYMDNLSKNTNYVTVKSTLPASGTFSGAGATSSADLAQDHIVIYTGAKCNGSTGVTPASSRNNAVVGQIEAGGSNKFYCQDAS